jgi:hypothetical protein
LSILLFKVNRGQSLAAVDQFGCQDTMRGLGLLLSLPASLFIKYLEAVAFANILLKVNVRGKYVSQLGE